MSFPTYYQRQTNRWSLPCRNRIGHHDKATFVVFLQSTTGAYYQRAICLTVIEHLFSLMSSLYPNVTHVCLLIQCNSNVILYLTVPYKGNNTVVMTTHKTSGITVPQTPQVTSPTAHVTPPDAHTGEPVRQTTTFPVLPTGAGM